MDQRGYNLMVDFETLGVSRDSVVLSVGLVVFTNEKVERKVYLEFDIRTQIAEGRIIMPDTLAWWEKTNPVEARRLICSGISTLFRLKETIAELRKSFPRLTVWSRHPMDFEIMNDILEDEFPFYTFKDTSSFDTLQRMSQANNHNALDDCLNQVDHVQGVWKVWDTAKSAEENSKATDASTVTISSPQLS